MRNNFLLGIDSYSQALLESRFHKGIALYLSWMPKSCKKKGKNSLYLDLEEWSLVFWAYQIYLTDTIEKQATYS
jgi:hypothetical protein